MRRKTIGKICRKVKETTTGLIEPKSLFKGKTCQPESRWFSCAAHISSDRGIFQKVLGGTGKTDSFILESNCANKLSALSLVVHKSI